MSGCNNIWDCYDSRMGAKGSTRRERAYLRTVSTLDRKLSASLSFKHLIIDGEERDAAVLDSDNYNQKVLYSMPGETIRGGAMVEWADNHWIVIEKDADTELQTRTMMQQCNYLLRWINKKKEIVERWCIVTDGTKYLTGETISSYNDNGMSLGDTRIALILSRDEETVQLSRDNRFLIDDYESGSVLAYRLTKPFKLGAVYNNEGAMSFVLSEVNTEDDDNFELHIADYYSYFPEERPDPIGTVNDKGRKVWF